MTDHDEPRKDERAVLNSLRALERRPLATLGWSSGDVVRRTVLRRRRHRLILGGTAAAIVVVVALTLSLTSGPSDHHPVHVVAAPGVHVGARIDGAVQLVSDAHDTPVREGQVAPIVHAQQLLAIKLLQTLGNDSRNVSVSPESLQLALGMLQNGARGTTRTQIATALQSAGLSTQQQNAGLAALTAQLSAAASRHLQLDSANSLWLQQGNRLRSTFLAAIAKYYGSGVWQTNFQTSQGLDAINHWTDVNTHGKIPKLFDQLDPQTVLVLATALYLHANWQDQFVKGSTVPGPFTTGRASIVHAQFMTAESGLRTADTADYAAAQLPYSGGRFAALVVMPKHASLGDFVDGLTPTSLAGVLDSLGKRNSGIALPRFTTSTTTDLVPTLRRLGMRQAFGTSSDLSGLGLGAASVDQVVQRVYLHVDERGTTAAAATGVAIGVSSLRSGPLRIDHPFLFLVRDTKTGAILFATEVNDPTAG